MELSQKGNRIWLEFDSSSDLLDFVSNPKFRKPGSPSVSRAHPDKYQGLKFYGTENFGEATDLMKFGWSEGRERISKFLVDIQKLVMSYLPETEIHYDVVGDNLDIGAFLSGEPECWQSFRETEEFKQTAAGKIIHITVNICAAWFYEPEAYFARGAAGVALVDALERMGHRVIMDAIATIGGYDRKSYAEKFLETRIRVKNANEGVQLDKLAFLFAHASVLRRILFAAWENLPPPIRDTFNIQEFGSYGHVERVPEEDQGDILVDGLLDNKYQDMHTLSQWVLERLSEQGILLREEV